MSEFFSFTRHFFHGWKRRVGLITLAMSLALIAAWVNSYRIEYLVWSKGFQMASSHGGVFWEKDSNPFNAKLTFTSKSEIENVTDVYRDPVWRNFWHWRVLGFAFGEREVTSTASDGSKTKTKRTCYRVPYWSISIPVTVLTTYLLLSVPLGTYARKLSSLNGIKFDSPSML